MAVYTEIPGVAFLQAPASSPATTTLGSPCAIVNKAPTVLHQWFSAHLDKLAKN
jgi:hypothetical protein